MQQPYAGRALQKHLLCSLCSQCIQVLLDLNEHFVQLWRVLQGCV